MINRTTTDSFLSKAEQDKLEIFAKDEVMLETVKKVLLSSIYDNGILTPEKKSVPLRNAAFSLVSGDQDKKLTDEQVGRNLKVMWNSIDLLESAYEQIKLYNTKDLMEKEIKKNIAR